MLRMVTCLYMSCVLQDTCTFQLNTYKSYTGSTPLGRHAVTGTRGGYRNLTGIAGVFGVCGGVPVLKYNDKPSDYNEWTPQATYHNWWIHVRVRTDFYWHMPMWNYDDITCKSRAKLQTNETQYISQITQPEHKQTYSNFKCTLGVQLLS